MIAAWSVFAGAPLEDGSCGPGHHHLFGLREKEVVPKKKVERQRAWGKKKKKR